MCVLRGAGHLIFFYETALTPALSPCSLLNDAKPMFPKLQPGPPGAAGHTQSWPFLFTFRCATPSFRAPSSARGPRSGIKKGEPLFSAL